MELRCGGHSLPYRLLDKEQRVKQADIVDSRRLEAALALVRERQKARDIERPASPKITRRDKKRIRALM